MSGNSNVVGQRPVALITGASRGLGFLLAREYARRGYDLVICARDRDGLERASDDLRAVGRQVTAIPADVSDAAEGQRLVADCERRHGRLDVLVTNAGIITVGPAADMITGDFAAAMDVMLWGTVHVTLAALPLLRRRRGRILAITSVGGKLPAPHLLPYCTAKHAAVGFAEGLRVEAGRDGVSVTVAVPGLMRTGSTRNAIFTGQAELEHRWFTIAGSMPLLSMDAERAASRLVRAADRRRPEVTLTPLAKVGVQVHAIAPNTTLRMLGWANALLPGPIGEQAPNRPGHAAGASPAWFRWLTGLDRAAAARWHQFDDPTRAG